MEDYPAILFAAHGDRGYTMVQKPSDIAFIADRLRREREEWHGELVVSINGGFPQAKTVNGVLLSGSFNFSSPTTRKQRAQLLNERAHTGTAVDWFGLLEEFCLRILEAERRGRPSVLLSDVPDDEHESSDTWVVDDFPVLKYLPTVIYGLGDSGKSAMAMYFAGSLALAGVRVLYADWEMSGVDHRRRLAKLFDPMPAVRYVRCDKPLVSEIDRLVRIVADEKIAYVILDSMVFALDGPADDEQAGLYFRAVRQLKCGTLHIAHTSKAEDDEKSIYGSIFFFNGARSVWFIQRIERAPRNEVHVGLFHTKMNTGPKSEPLGYKLVHEEGKTIVGRIDVGETDELVARLPAWDRLQHILRFGPKTFADIADEMNLKRLQVKALMIRHKSALTKTDGKPPRYGLAQSERYEV